MHENMCWIVFHWKSERLSKESVVKSVKIVGSDVVKINYKMKLRTFGIRGHIVRVVKESDLKSDAVRLVGSNPACVVTKFCFVLKCIAAIAKN